LEYFPQATSPLGSGGASYLEKRCRPFAALIAGCVSSKTQIALSRRALMGCDAMFCVHSEEQIDPA